MMHRQRWIIVLAMTVIFSSLSLPAKQESGSNSGATPATTESSSSNKTKYSHANDLLIRGTVFDNRALSLPGAKLRIRQAGAKKAHWETYTNARGEFAIRVPQGANYEIEAESKGFAKQSREFNGKDGNADEKMVFRMEPLTGGKP
jgi:hypothetical protein